MEHKQQEHKQQEHRKLEHNRQEHHKQELLTSSSNDCGTNPSGSDH